RCGGRRGARDPCPGRGRPSRDGRPARSAGRRPWPADRGCRARRVRTRRGRPPAVRKSRNPLEGLTPLSWGQTMTMKLTWADEWQRSWDRQQEGYMPDREARLGALVDIVEAVAGTAPLVLDLACGTASISRRLLARLPEARTVAVDIDPALLAIAE